MAPRKIRHRVERTRNRHSRAVVKDETIIIRLAKNLSRTEEHEHIEYLLRRMTQIVLEDKKRKAIHPFRHLLEGGQTLTVTIATGRSIHFTLEADARSRAQRTREGWHVSVSPRVRRAVLHRFLWRLTAHTEQARIERLVHEINDETFRVPVRAIKLQFASSQWGSCSPRGVIMINAALLFLPPSLLRYVIIHELAHRRKSDHSPAYWNIVASVLPHYERLRKQLHEYRLPSL